MLTIQQTGDWGKLMNTLNRLNTQLVPTAKARLYEDGTYALERLQGHIQNQDLAWDRLSEITVQLKQDERIYIETGELADSFGIFKGTDTSTGCSYFISASSYKVHQPSGLKYTELLMYLEYGTIRQPARPLFSPTYDELKKQVRQSWKNYLKELVRG